MTDLNDLPFTHDDGRKPNGATGRPRCRRHEWAVGPNGIAFCLRCDHERDEAATRRGRTNRQRGNAIEREVGRKLGLRRVGQYGGPDDLTGDMFAAQVKSGGSFSERYWAWLKAVPVTADQTQLLVVTDAPGPGHRRRGFVVIDLDDWADWHGGGK